MAYSLKTNFRICSGLLFVSFFTLQKSLAQDFQSCEQKAFSSFKKAAVEIAMASITGSVGEIEAEKNRELIHQRLERERFHCKKWTARVPPNSSEML